MFFLIAPVVAVSNTNQKYLNYILSKANKYNLKMKVYKPSSLKPFHIDNPGTEHWIDYEKYGEFQNLDKSDYKYEITDLQGLKDA
jgi:hypothetical protein